MASVVNSFGILGVDGYIVTIEVDTIYGQPSVSIVGLGDMAIKESKERLEAAVIHAKGTSSKTLRERVETARKFQRKRFENISGINCNAQMTPAHIKEFCKLEEECIKMLQLAFERFSYSARSFHKFLKVARTFADLEECDSIRKSHIAKALLCRELDKEQSQMVVVKAL